MSIPASDERWENWLQFTQSRLVPKFTEVKHTFILYLLEPQVGYPRYEMWHHNSSQNNTWNDEEIE